MVGVARPTLKTSRAARFWMDFSLLISFSYTEKTLG